MKILIAIPTFETVSVETFKSIYNADKCGHDVRFDSIKGYDCARARNMIGNVVLDAGYDYVLMVDSDIILPTDALEHLLEPSADVVFGCYPHKNTKDHEVELFKPNQPNYVERYRYHELEGKIRVPVKGAGFGCALLKADVFRRIPFPWFKYVTYNNNSVLSEDLYFCTEAKKSKVSMIADTRVRCGHLHKDFRFD